MKKRVVVLSGAGISAESGVKTFRDHGGLWDSHRVEDVATPEAWERNPELVLRFYNERRRLLGEVQPNAGHQAIASWEKNFEVIVVTQNVDDLHERAGSTRVLHLHGELRKARSSLDPELVYPLEHWEMRLEDRCEKGSRLRPHIVWFGESVSLMPVAEEFVAEADALVVVGTSLSVYPAAGLAWMAPHDALKILVDPRPAACPEDFQVFSTSATLGVPQAGELLNQGLLGRE
ncbi:MAG: NAD-dependent deacetylase [Verrucomicrobiales bacterium]